MLSRGASRTNHKTTPITYCLTLVGWSIATLAQLLLFANKLLFQEWPEMATMQKGGGSFQSLCFIERSSMSFALMPSLGPSIRPSIRICHVWKGARRKCSITSAWKVIPFIYWVRKMVMQRLFSLYFLQGRSDCQGMPWFRKVWLPLVYTCVQNSKLVLQALIILSLGFGL